MRFRLSNEIDWATEIVAHDAGELRAACRTGWARHADTHGINSKHRLWLHVYANGEWVTSGQYDINRKIKLPPTPHEINSNTSSNDWTGLFNAAELSYIHATQSGGLSMFVNEVEASHDEPKNNFLRIIQK